jgi:hypothetical protein
MGVTFTDPLGTLLFGLVQQPAGVYSASSIPPGATITTASLTGGDATTLHTGQLALSTGWTCRTFQTAGTVSAVNRNFLRAKISETP